MNNSIRKRENKQRITAFQDRLVNAKVSSSLLLVGKRNKTSHVNNALLLPVVIDAAEGTAMDRRFPLSGTAQRGPADEDLSEGTQGTARNACVCVCVLGSAGGVSCAKLTHNVMRSMA